MANEDFPADYTTDQPTGYSTKFNTFKSVMRNRYERVVSSVSALAALSSVSWAGRRVWVTGTGVATYNGSSWDYDTGWQTVSIRSLSGLTATEPLQYRVLGSVVWLSGQLTYTAGYPASGSMLTVATLPVAARPVTPARPVASAYQSTTARVPVIGISTAGVMTVGSAGASSSGATFNDLYLDGLCYLKD